MVYRLRVLSVRSRIKEVSAKDQKRPPCFKSRDMEEDYHTIFSEQLAPGLNCSIV